MRSALPSATAAAAAAHRRRDPGIDAVAALQQAALAGGVGHKSDALGGHLVGKGPPGFAACAGGSRGGHILLLGGRGGRGGPRRSVRAAGADAADKLWQRRLLVLPRLPGGVVGTGLQVAGALLLQLPPAALVAAAAAPDAQSCGGEEWSGRWALAGLVRGRRGWRRRRQQAAAGVRSAHLGVQWHQHILPLGSR